jgi:hypothetical protein
MNTNARLRPAPARPGRESGQVLVMFALLGVVLIGFMALALDVGIILHERRQLQNAADAAALAGAVELPASPTLANEKAAEWAENNEIDLAEGDQLTVNVDTAENTVYVRVERDVPFLFGRVLGLVSIDVTAEATAKVGAPAALSNLLPFGVPEDAIDYQGPTVLKYDATNPTVGNFGALGIDGPGAAVHRDSIQYGSENAICAASQPACEYPFVNTQTGNMTGPTRTGFNYRFDNTSSECDEFDEVLLPAGDGETYRIHGPCNPFSDGSESLRLVLVPVIDGFCNGHCLVEVQYFALMFLEEMGPGGCTGNKCEVTGTFVKAILDPYNDAFIGEYDETSGVNFVRLID